MRSGSISDRAARKPSALLVSSTCSRQMTRPRAPSLAAATHVEAQRRVAEAGEHLRSGDTAAAVLVAAEPMEDQEGGPPLARAPPVVGHVQHSRELEPLRYERDALFHGPPPRATPAYRSSQTSCIRA